MELRQKYLALSTESTSCCNNTTLHWITARQTQENIQQLDAIELLQHPACMQPGPWAIQFSPFLPYGTFLAGMKLWNNRRCQGGMPRDFWLQRQGVVPPWNYTACRTMGSNYRVKWFLLWEIIFIHCSIIHIWNFKGKNAWTCESP